MLLGINWILLKNWNVTVIYSKTWAVYIHISFVNILVFLNWVQHVYWILKGDSTPISRFIYAVFSYNEIAVCFSISIPFFTNLIMLIWCCPLYYMWNLHNISSLLIFWECLYFLNSCLFLKFLYENIFFFLIE